jgi:hypothetical protein
MTVEERLRGALSARAGQITADRLQPALPPTVAGARRTRMAWLAPLLAGTAAVVLLLFTAMLLGHRPTGEVPATVPSPAVSISPAPSLPPGPAGKPAPPAPAPGSKAPGNAPKPKAAAGSNPIVPGSVPRP